MNANGIDISYANGTTPALTGREFVIVRACYGTVKDTRWEYHSDSVRRQGRILGAYAFGVNGDGAAQARAFLAIAHDADFLALDWERDGNNPEMTAAQAAAFIDTVQSAHREIGLYHSDSGFPSAGQDWNWVAKWGTAEPTRPWRFWQYRGYPLDLNYFHGDEAELAAFAGTGGTVVVTDPTPKLVNLPAGRQLFKPDGRTPLVKLVPATVDTYSPAGGPAGNQRYVVVTTGGVRQQAVVMVAGLVFRAYPTVATTRNDVAVTLTVNGTEDFSRTY